MRSHVFNDPGLMKHAGRFVWLSIDTEKESNASFVEAFPVQSWPTLFIIDSANQKAVFKWLGSANVAELDRLLSDGEQGLLGSSNPLDDNLARADSLFAQGKSSEAAAAYATTLEQAPMDWPKRSRATESLVFALQSARENKRCADVPLKYGTSLPRDAAFANVAVVGLTCALMSSEAEPWQKAAIAKLEPMNREALQISNLLADDRSGIYEVLINAREVNKDKEGVRALASEWLEFLEQQAAKAPTPEARSAFDSHRLVAALRLGQLERVIPVLEASEHHLPNDYNPPARLAIAFRELGRYGDAVAAVNRALSKAYGPRKLRVFETKVSILTRKGDIEAARSTLEEALKFSQSIPSHQLPKAVVKKMKTDLENLDRPPRT